VFLRNIAIFSIVDFAGIGIGILTAPITIWLLAVDQCGRSDGQLASAHNKSSRRSLYAGIPSIHVSERVPELSTTPETIKTNLKALITDTALREAIGRASRDYAEKYHSYETAAYLFG
jgi:hypothetical protein